MARFKVDLNEPNLLGRDYGVELWVGESSARQNKKTVRLGKFVKGVKITHDIKNVWPIFHIQLGIDVLELIGNDLYGQKTLSIRIVRSDQDNSIKEDHTIELLWLDNDMTFTSKTTLNKSDSPGHIDFQTTTITCVPLYAYNMMSTFVNFMLEEESAPTDAVALLENIMTNQSGYRFDARKILIDKRNRNTSLINQMIIPPMTFKDAIAYLNSEFYYYMGPAFTFCDIDGNFKMWSLHEKMKDTQVSNIVMFPATTSFDEPFAIDTLLELAAHDGELGWFFVDKMVDTSYRGNARLMNKGYHQIYTSHPGNNLYQHVIENMGQAADRFSTADPDAAHGLKIHPNLRNQKRYIHNNGGTNPGNSAPELSTSKISEDIMDLQGMVVRIKGNLFFNKLFRIGEPVLFDGMSMTYISYGGKYLLHRSEVLMSRDTTDNWTAESALWLYRTNQSQVKNNDGFDRLPIAQNITSESASGINS